MSTGHGVLVKRVLGRLAWLKCRDTSQQKAGGTNLRTKPCHDSNSVTVVMVGGMETTAIKKDFLRLGWTKMCFENFKAPS